MRFPNEYHRRTVEGSLSTGFAADTYSLGAVTLPSATTCAELCPSHPHLCTFAARLSFMRSWSLRRSLRRVVASSPRTFVRVKRVSIHQVNVYNKMRQLVRGANANLFSIELVAPVLLHVPDVTCVTEAKEATAVLGSAAKAPERRGARKLHQLLHRESCLG